MNIFKFGMYGNNSIRGIFNNIKQFLRNIKYAKQRCLRGFADCDTWDMDIYLVKLLRDMLVYFADNTHGYPGVEPFETPEKWHKWLIDTAALLDNSIDKSFEKNQVYKNKYEDEYSKLLDSIQIDERTKSVVFKDEELVDKYLAEELNVCERRKVDRNLALQRLIDNWDRLWD